MSIHAKVVGRLAETLRAIANAPPDTSMVSIRTLAYDAARAFDALGPLEFVDDLREEVAQALHDQTDPSTSAGMGARLDAERVLAIVSRHLGLTGKAPAEPTTCTCAGFTCASCAEAWEKERREPCKPWCGQGYSWAPPGSQPWRARNRSYCTEACRDAGRPLNPPTSAPLTDRDGTKDAKKEP